MNKLNKISKIFFIMSIATMLTAAVLLLVHTYLGDRHYDSGLNFFPPVSKFLNPQKKEFNVAIASDTANNNLVLEKIVKDIRKSDKKYSFILYLGDLTNDRVRTNFYWMLWELKPELKNMPLYMVPGNHDVEKHHDIDESFYRSVMGQEYYWFGYGDVLFIGIDSSGVSMENEQLTWLSDTLTKVRPLFKYCVIFGHRPPKDPTNNPSGMKNRNMNKKTSDKFISILSKHKVDLMVFGHVHYYSEDKIGKIPMYTTPSAGQKIRSDVNKYGYISLRIGKNGIEHVEPKYINFSGSTGELMEAKLVSNILSQNLRKIISIILILSATCFTGGIIAHCITNKKRNTS